MLLDQCRGFRGGGSPSTSALLFELAFDRVAVLLRAGARGPALRLQLALRLARLGLLLLVHDLADLRRGRAERLDRLLDPVRVVRLERVAERGELLLDVLLRVSRDLVAEVAERLFDLVRERVAFVAGLDALAVATVLLSVHLGVLHEALDLVLAEAARRGDRHVLLAAGRLVLRLHVHDAVRVDVERHLDLRDAARRGRDAVEHEPREALVVRGELPLALDDVDLDLGLTVARRGEGLRLRGRDRRVALDQLRGDATERLDAERERRHVEEQDVLHLALEHAGLDRRADRDDLVRVHALVRLLAVEQLAHRPDDRRHPRHAADEDDLVDLVRRDAGVGEALLHRADRLLDEVADELFELAPRERHDEVLRTRRVGGDERQVDLRLLGRAELDLRLLRGLLEPLERHAVALEVDALVLLELLDEPVHDPLVEVVAAEVRVAVRRLHLEDAFAELQDRDVEGAAAEAVDGDDLVLLLVEPVRKRRRGRLVDDPQDLEARDLARVLRRLALLIVEVRRDGDDRLRDLLAEMRLGIGLELLEDHRRDLGRRELFAVAEHDLDAAVGRLLDLVGDHLDGPLHLGVGESPAHEALDRVDRVLAVRDRLSLRDLADETLPGLRERDDRRRDPPALRVRDDRRLAAFHVGDGRVRGAEVNADDLSHCCCSPSSRSHSIPSPKRDE